MLTDNQIIDLFHARSEQAITELSEKYGRTCRRLSVNILKNPYDAEECVNDAYLGVWNTVPPRRPDSLPAYVCRIVRNLSLKRYRENTAVKRNSYYDAVLDELAECIPSPDTLEEAYAVKELTETINRFLSTLDKESRVMFMRRYWFSDSIEEIAGLFGTQKHNVSVKLSRIRQKLKRHLEKEGIVI